MPRKVFTAGEVLAAADVNEFLQDQAVMSFAGTAARGSAIGTATEGMLTYLNDTDTFQFWNGSDWTNLTSSPTWTSFTPTWTNLTVGNGTYVSSVYWLDGKLAHVAVTLVFGSTTSISGPVSFTVPAALTRKNAGTNPNMSCILTDAGVNNFVGHIMSPTANATQFLVRISLAGGTYTNLDEISSTVPMTWTTSDRLDFSMSYEVA
jgi:hypothetical protein